VVPDYCPDIVRIAETSAHFNFAGKEIRGGRIYADGTLETSVLYVPETGGGLRKINLSLPVSQAFELPDDVSISDPSMVFVSAVAASVNSRELNPRKIAVKASVNFNYRVFEKHEVSITSGIGGTDEYGLEYKTAPFGGKVCIRIKEKVLTLTDSAELSDAITGDAEILKYELAPTITDVKQIPNKLVIKGEVAANLLIREGGDGGVSSCDTSFPFSGVVECQGITDESQTKPSIRVTSGELKLSRDSSTDKLLLSAHLILSVCAENWEEFETDVVTDVYSVSHEIQYEVSTVKTSPPGDDIAVSSQHREIIPTGMEIHTVWSCTAEAESAAVFRDEGKSSVSVDAKVKLIFETDDGGVYSLSKNISVAMELDSDAPLKAASYSVSGVGYHISGSEDIEVQFAAEAVCVPSRELEITQVSAVTVGEPLERTGRRPALTLCSAVDGESFWDLAKRLRTSASDIKTANDLTGDCPPYGKLLLVPRRY